MGREDQIEEREVLDSIFPEEITGKKAALYPPCTLHYENSQTTKSLTESHPRYF